MNSHQTSGTIGSGPFQFLIVKLTHEILERLNLLNIRIGHDWAPPVRSKEDKLDVFIFEMAQEILGVLLLGPDVVKNQFAVFVKGIADLVSVPEGLEFEDLGKEDENYTWDDLSII